MKKREWRKYIFSDYGKEYDYGRDKDLELKGTIVDNCVIMVEMIDKNDKNHYIRHDYDYTQFAFHEYAILTSMYKTWKKQKKENTKTDSVIDEIIFNPPATIIKWSDKTKTVVKCQRDDYFDAGKGVALAVLKKMLNSKDYSKLLKEVAKFDSELKEIRKEARNRVKEKEATYNFLDNYHKENEIDSETERLRKEMPKEDDKNGK